MRVGTDGNGAKLYFSTVLQASLSFFDAHPSKPTLSLNRRAQLRAELGAAFFHLYGIEREDVEYILDQFPVLRRSDEKAFGEFRTKRLVLAEFDKLADLATKQAINA